MKNQAGIWIDAKKAVIVKLKENHVSVVTIKSHVAPRHHDNSRSNESSRIGGHYISSEKHVQNRRHEQLHHFLMEVQSGLRNIDEVTIMGPAETKSALKKVLQSDKSHKLKLGAVLAADKMTEKQLVAKVKEIYPAKK